VGFILWSMGLVLALFVGCLAWRIVFYLFAVVIGLFVSHPRWMFGIIGAAIVLPVVVVAGIVAWVNHFEPPIVHYHENNLIVTSPSPTPLRFGPEAQKVMDNFLRDQIQHLKSSSPQADPAIESDSVKAEKNKPVTVRRAELVKP
jgi:hypothetical protein